VDFPENLRYTSDHEWILLTEEDSNDGNQLAVVGITDYAQNELGELVYVEVDSLGEELQKGAVFGTVEAVKTTSDLFMPVSGEIVAFNPELDEKKGDNPAIINEDPYGKGWIIKLRITDPEELETLLNWEKYKSLVDSG
jgi:glycine cleavage system H protein